MQNIQLGQIISFTSENNFMILQRYDNAIKVVVINRNVVFFKFHLFENVVIQNVVHCYPIFKCCVFTA